MKQYLFLFLGYLLVFPFFLYAQAIFTGPFAAQTAGDNVTISWNISDASIFKIYGVAILRGSSPTTPPASRTIVEPHDLDFTQSTPNRSMMDTPPQTGQKYYYWVHVSSYDFRMAYLMFMYDAIYNSQAFGPVVAWSGTLPTIPAPTLTVSKGTSVDGIYLDWTAVPEATSYTIFYGLSEDTSTMVQQSDWTSTSAKLSAPTGVTYYFAIKADNSTAQSDFSNIDYGFWTPEIPPPQNLTATKGTRNDGVAITWEAVKGDDVTYHVYRGETPDTLSMTLLVDGLTETNWLDSAMLDAPPEESDKTYYYAAKTEYTNAFSPFSNVDLGYLLTVNPVVFIHGWGGSAGTWANMRRLLMDDPETPYPANKIWVVDKYDGSGDSIQKLAQEVAVQIKDFSALHEKPVDVVAHSMGGLVLRSALAQPGVLDSSHVRRFISIATPHYGQGWKSVFSTQQQEMSYGSELLWDLATAWHFGGKNLPSANVLCIAGLEPDSDDWYWDGLVHHWSAALADTAVRYVARSHSKIPGYFDGPPICGCPGGHNDPVYVLVKNFLMTGTSTPTGADPQDHFWSDPIASGAIFLQVVDGTGNPVAYNGFIVDGWSFAGHSGYWNSAREKGIELVTQSTWLPGGDVGLPAQLYSLNLNASAFWHYQVANPIQIPVNPGRVSVTRVTAELSPLYVVVDELTKIVSGGAGQLMLDVITSVSALEWTAVSTEPWLTLQTTSGTGSGALAYSVQANDTPNERVGTIVLTYTVNASTESVTITVTQAPPSTSSEVPVPHTWMQTYFPNADSGAYDAIANSDGTNGVPVWESYVADLDPTNKTSRFLITNLVVNADSQVTALDWTPYRPDRTYKVWGKTNLTDSAWYYPINGASRFFKVSVDL
ncbi:MAG: hypothetical protein FWH21_04450 [Kiritimatiellaeota bacterium]|nr:hypothetical protein [Kiritimatiellota bacterium]